MSERLMLLYGMEDTPRWCLGRMRRSKPFNEHAVADGNDGLAGVVEPTGRNVEEDALSQFGDVIHATPVQKDRP